MVNLRAETSALLECARRRAIGEIESCELEGACGIAATARVELGAVIGERKRMLRE
jgi:hypothetical protein